MVVCITGVSTFNPFRFVQKSPVMHYDKPFGTPEMFADGASPATWKPLKLRLPAPTRAIR